MSQSAAPRNRASKGPVHTQSTQDMPGKTLILHVSLSQAGWGPEVSLGRWGKGEGTIYLGQWALSFLQEAPGQRRLSRQDPRAKK